MFDKFYPSIFDGFLTNETDLFESLFNQFNKTLKPTVGETKTESGVNEDGSKWYKTTFTSKDGSYTQSVYSSTPNFEKTLTSKTTVTDSTITELQEKLNKAVETQDYENAVKWRDEIRSYKKNADEVNTLKSKLETAVSTQNYEEAIKLRDKINKLTNN
jgi:protein-arginine kinase activator protein McsA